MSSRARYVVVCGNDGSGKTGLVKAAKVAFPSLVVTREPGGSESAEKVRELMLSSDFRNAGAFTQLALMFAARSALKEELVGPTLQKGVPVLSDRGDACTYAFQIHGQQQYDLTSIFWEMRRAVFGSHPPDHYVFMDVDPVEGVRRRMTQRGQGTNHFDERELDFHQRVRVGYLEFCARPEISSTILDANESESVVLAKGLQLLGELLMA